MELRLILNEENQLNAIKKMHQLDLLQVISPKIQFNDSLKELLEQVEKVIAWYKLLFLEEPVEFWLVYWHGITSQLEPWQLKETFKKMDFLDKEGVRILTQRKSVTMLLDELFKHKEDNYLLYTLLHPYDTELLLYLMARTQSEKIRRLISKYFTQLKGTKVNLNGRDLLSMGIRPGPIFKEVFESLLQARMDGLVKSKGEEVKFVQENFKGKIAV